MSQPLWRPSQESIDNANITHFMSWVWERYNVEFADYAALYNWSIKSRDIFWDAIWEFAGVLAEHKGERILESREQMPGAKWFPDARLNFARNLLQRRDNDTAIIFRGEDQVQCTLSHAELYIQTSKLVAGLRVANVKVGDRVAAYLPNMPETVVAMLATTSLGAIWSSCSPDFGVQGALDRFSQIGPKILLSTDGYFYNGKSHDLLGKLRDIVEKLPSVQKVLVVPYISNQPDIKAIANAEHFYEFLDLQTTEDMEFTELPFDHPIYIMFSSGTTGVPKSIVHGAGGTLLQHLKEQLLHTDVKPDTRLFYFTTCGWMMWNWLVSGLASGATLMLYDGSPFFPDGNTLFNYIDEGGINIFGVSAKYIDSVHKAGIEPLNTHKLESLRTILSTGSPLMPESFDFVYKKIKKDVCLSSIAGGTDIISCFALGNPLLPVWPGELQCRGLGMQVEVFDDQGQTLRGQKGELVCSAPFPSMPVGFWDDADGSQYHKAYFARFPNIWCHGDYVKLTEHDGLIIYGRSDAVLNPGGVRIGTAEIYRQAEQIEEVLESLVIGQNWKDDVRIVLFVCLRDDVILDEALIERIKQQIRAGATPRHVPAKIIQVSDIPRTKSGKIVELAVRSIVHGEPVKNKEALANPEALALFENRPELQEN